jgi:toluene monooxygenase system protein E
LPPQKTYWHLAPRRRIPTEYEVVSSRLLYYVDRGFEVHTPIGPWYERYQRGSRLVDADWEGFADPCATTYRTYTGRQDARETFVDTVLEAMERAEYRAALPREWLDLAERLLAPAVYPWHGFQMIAAYIGQMAPAGRITLAGLFQAADEMRRVQRIAYWTRLHQLSAPLFASGRRAAWERDPLWQPLREVVEKLLVAYDWGEAFAALNLVVKPVLDTVLLSHVAARAREAGDDLLGHVLRSLEEDCGWHRAWSAALVRHAIAARPENLEVIGGWVRRWSPAADRALEPVAVALAGEAAAGEIAAAVRRTHGEFLAAAGVERPGEPRV